MSHKNDLSACIKWRAGNANGGRLEESPRAGKLSNGTFGRRQSRAVQGRAGLLFFFLGGRQIALQAMGAIEAVVVLSLCQIQLGLIGVRES